MKYLKLFSVISICLLSNVADAQMKHFFMMLPAECTPDLSRKEKEILIADGKFQHILENSSEDFYYTLSANQLPDYLIYNQQLLDQDNGYRSFELKKLVHNNDSIIIFSRSLGFGYLFKQTTLKVFEIGKDTLIESTKYNLPAQIDGDEFVKLGVPDSMKAMIHAAPNYGYILATESTNTIEYKIVMPLWGINNWMTLYALSIYWDGEVFTKSLLKE